MHRRLENEMRTIEVMLDIYCRAHHNTTGTLCHSCTQLSEYAKKRLLRCRFQGNKPTCANCTVHCYSPGNRSQIREVMRYAGPRMVYKHPLMAFRHAIDGLRSVDPVEE